MTYAILYTENGDFVADFDSEEEAMSAFQRFVADYPSASDRIGLMAFDDAGCPIGDLILGTSVAVGDAQPA